MGNDTNTIALFVDFENLETSVRKQQEKSRTNLEPVIETLNSMGSTIIRRAYGDWVQHADYRHNLIQCGLELIERPNITPGRNGADIKLSVDAVEIAIKNPHIDTFVLICGNSDFLPLIQKLREFNRKVYVIGIEATVSNLIRKNCDKFIAYETLAKGRKAPTATAPPAAASTPRRESSHTEPSIPAKTVDLIGRAAKAKGGRMDSGSLRKLLKKADPSFVERNMGFSSFNDMLDLIKKKKLISGIEIESKGNNYFIIVTEGPTAEPQQEWEDRELREEEWEALLDAVETCVTEGAGRPNQGKLWIVNAYLHKKRVAGLLPLANHVLSNALELLVKEGVLQHPNHDTYLTSENFVEKKEEFLDEMFGEEVEVEYFDDKAPKSAE